MSIYVEYYHSTQPGEEEWITANADDNTKTFNPFDIERTKQHFIQVEIDSVNYTRVRLVMKAVQV